MNILTSFFLNWNTKMDALDKFGVVWAAFSLLFILYMMIKSFKYLFTKSVTQGKLE